MFSNLFPIDYDPPLLIPPPLDANLRVALRQQSRELLAPLQHDQAAFLGEHLVEAERLELALELTADFEMLRQS